jgi:hypothetical protein
MNVRLRTASGIEVHDEHVGAALEGAHELPHARRTLKVRSVLRRQGPSRGIGRRHLHDNKPRSAR